MIYTYVVIMSDHGQYVGLHTQTCDSHIDHGSHYSHISVNNLSNVSYYLVKIKQYIFNNYL